MLEKLSEHLRRMRNEASDQNLQERVYALDDMVFRAEELEELEQKNKKALESAEEARSDLAECEEECREKSIEIERLETAMNTCTCLAKEAL